MSDQSKIEWCDATWNPVRGCVQVSPGCAHCYAEVFAERFRGVPGHPYEQGFDLRLVPEKLDEPLSWTKPRRVFVNSMSDLFQDGVPDDFIDQVFATMALTPRHTYQVLTKRADRMRAYVRSRCYPNVAVHLHAILMNADSPDATPDAGWPLPNVWLGVSVENQHVADERIPLLLQTPAAVRFLSCEPLLAHLNVAQFISANYISVGGRQWIGAGGIGWVIVGGESGPGARPMHPDWARSIRDQCQAAGVAYFFKQWGEWAPTTPQAGGDLGGDVRRGVVEIVRRDREADGHFRRGDVWMRRVGKKAAGRVLDGREWNEYPSAGREAQ